MVIPTSGYPFLSQTIKSAPDQSSTRNSLIREMWHKKVGFHEPARVKHTAEWWWIVMRTTWPTSKAPAEITLTFRQHFYTPLGCASYRHGCAWIRTHRHVPIHSESTQTHKNTHQSLSFQSDILSVLPFSLSCFHIQTHSHSGGVIECDSKSWEGCWRVIRLTCEM